MAEDRATGRAERDGTARLQAERAVASARAAALAEELAAVVTATRDANLDDEHDVEGPTVAFERQRIAGLLQDAQAALVALDAAATRLAESAYGTCGRCGGPIGAERLAALPATTRCRSCADDAGRQRPR